MSKQRHPRRLQVECLELRSMLTAHLIALVSDGDGQVVGHDLGPAQETRDQQRFDRSADIRSENRSEQRGTSHQNKRDSDHRDRRPRQQDRRIDLASVSAISTPNNSSPSPVSVTIGSDFQGNTIAGTSSALVPSRDVDSPNEPVSLDSASGRLVGQQEQTDRIEASKELSQDLSAIRLSDAWSGTAESRVEFDQHAPANHSSIDRTPNSSLPFGLTEDQTRESGLIDPLMPLAVDQLQGPSTESDPSSEHWSIGLDSLHRLRGLAGTTDSAAVSQATDVVLNQWLTSESTGLIAIERFDLPLEQIALAVTAHRVNLDASVGQHRDLLIAAVEGSVPLAIQIRDRVLARVGAGDPGGKPSSAITFAAATVHQEPMLAGLPDAALMIGTFALAARRKRSSCPLQSTTADSTRCDPSRSDPNR